MGRTRKTTAGKKQKFERWTDRDVAKAIKNAHNKMIEDGRLIKLHRKDVIRDAAKNRSS
jgi:hypothetical protein